MFRCHYNDAVLIYSVFIVSRTLRNFPPQNEEVRFIENELENHKQKYFELQTFTRSLILAIKSDDKEQQQVSLKADFSNGRYLSFCVLSFPCF